MGSLSLGIPLHSISLSPSQTEAIVGGRNAIKVVQVDASSPPVETKTLKIASKNDVKFSIVNVEWSQAPGCTGLAAAALNNGAVAIWDLAVESPNTKQVKGWFAVDSYFPHPHAYQSEKLLTGHKRALNCVTWHPNIANVLLSCSMDNTMRLWDRRARGRYCAATFHPKGGFIRDVQFSPYLDHRFAAVSDDGQLQIWDQRMQKNPELRVQAHSLPVKAVAWHPVHPWVVATASRDRSIKVHDLDSPTLFWDGRPQPQFKDVLSTLYLPSPVSRIKWRPGRNSHIAACCDSGACTSSLFLYDTTEPYIPLAVLEGHTDVCTGFEWFNPSRIESGLDVQRGGSNGDDITVEQGALDSNDTFNILTCGKDGLIQVMSLHSATRPHEDIPPCIITTHPARGIMCASDSTFAMRDILSIRNLLEAESSMQSLPPTSESNNAALPSTFTSGIKSSLSVEMGDNSNNLSKQPVSNAAIVACDVNELKAHVSCRPQILTMWSPIPPAGRHGSAYYPPHIDGPDIDQITGYDPAVIEYLAKRYKLRGAPVSHLCTINAKTAMECGKFEMTRMWKILKILTSSTAMATATTSSLNTPQDHPQIIYNMGDMLDFRTSSNLLSEAQSSSPISQESYFHSSPTDENCSQLGGGGGSSSYQLVEKGHSSSSLANSTKSDPRMDNNKSFYFSTAQASGGGRDSQGRHGGDTGEGARWLLRGLVSDFVEHCIHSGDVQHCVALCEVLRAWEAEVGEGIFVKAEDFGMDKTRIREIWAAYIDILHRLKLWNCATDIIKTSDDAAMAELNQKGTSVVSACGACGTTCNPTSRCSKCAAIVSECSLCRQPVNGLFVWCPGCSHGGHLTHVHAWFSTHDVCPRGCGHKCNFSFKSEYKTTQDA